MASITVYGPPVTANYHRMAMMLNEVGITEYERVNVDLLKGEQRQPWYLAVNPLGKIPAFKDADVLLCESRAICRYLVERYAPGKAGDLLGRDPRERALVGQWQDVEAMSFHPSAAAVGQERLLKKLRGAPVDDARLQENLGKISALLDVYEAHLSKPDTAGFMACRRLTFADLTHAPGLFLLVDSGYPELIESRPHVAKWWAALSAHPAWAKVAAGPTLGKLAAGQSAP